MSGPIHYGPQFAVLQGEVLEESTTTVLFTEEIKKICREDKVCFLKFENGEELPFVITKKDPCYSPPDREIFEVGRYIPGHGAIGFVSEIEISRLNAGNLTLKHFLNLYAEYSFCLSKADSYEQVGQFIDFAERQEKNDWKRTLGEESFDEDFYTRYGRGRFSTEPETGFRENLFRPTKDDNGTGVIYGYVHKQFGDASHEENSRINYMLKLSGKKGETIFFSSFGRSVRTSKKTCALYSREEFIERLLVAEKVFAKEPGKPGFQKILDNFEVVEEFFGRPLSPIFLKEIAKQIVEGDRNKQICEYRVAKDYDKNSFALVLKNGIPPEVKSVVVARTPDEVPKFLGRLMLLGGREKDWER